MLLGELVLRDGVCGGCVGVRDAIECGSFGEFRRELLRKRQEKERERMEKEKEKEEKERERKLKEEASTTLERERREKEKESNEKEREKKLREEKVRELKSERDRIAQLEAELVEFRQKAEEVRKAEEEEKNQVPLITSFSSHSPPRVLLSDDSFSFTHDSVLSASHLLSFQMSSSHPSVCSRIQRT